jgi:hypothetical protein
MDGVVSRGGEAGVRLMPVVKARVGFSTFSYYGPRMIG